MGGYEMYIRSKIHRFGVRLDLEWGEEKGESCSVNGSQLLCEVLFLRPSKCHYFLIGINVVGSIIGVVHFYMQSLLAFICFWQKYDELCKKNHWI